MQFNFLFSHSAEDIFERITDPEFIIKRCLDIGSIEANCDSNGDDLRQLTISRLEAAELPSMMKKVVGDQQQMTTNETWSETSESYDSKSLTTISGTPIKIEASQCLYNTEDGSAIDVTLTVKANIPLIGKKVEPMVATKVREEMLREFEYLESNA